MANADLELWEHHIESEVDRDISVPPTDREAIITARRGQGLFKQRVMAIERFCRTCGPVTASRGGIPQTTNTWTERMGFCLRPVSIICSTEGSSAFRTMAN